MPKIINSKQSLVNSHSDFSRSSGFTLIELLVVIAIIAVLSTIGFLNYQQVVKKGRDSDRQSDLRVVQAALEQYHADNHFYPPSLDLTSTTQLDNCSGGVGSGSVPGCPTATKVYLKATPKDPKTSFTYLYTASGSSCGSGSPAGCNNYCIYAQLEANNDVELSGCSASGTYNFAVTRP